MAAGIAALLTTAAQAVQTASYDLVTDARARAAQNALENNYGAYSVYDDETATYNREQMHQLIESNRHLYVIRNLDLCQFTPDIEDRARRGGIAAFEYAWGDMLISGTCVTRDPKLGLEYFKRSLDHGYAPAFVRMADFYETGFLVPEDPKRAFRYMQAAATMGSALARLNFADMLVRGFADPSYYEQAYSWLYNTNFDDTYQNAKKGYIIYRLEGMMPPNIIARAKADYMVQ